MAQGVPFPPGWEQKLDANSRKFYYIDHINKKTQWVDPRLNHPMIWQQDKLQILESMKESFIDAPEQTLRGALLKHNFNSHETQNELVNAGFRLHRRQHPSANMANQGAYPSGHSNTNQTATQPAPRSPGISSGGNTTRSGTASSGAPETVDQFAIMQIKSRFPSVSDHVVRDVIVSSGGDVEDSCSALSSMGYEDRKMAEEKAAAVIAERKRLEEERRMEVQKQSVRDRLSGEFNHVSRTTINAVLDSSDYNYDTAKSILLIEEGVSVVKSEFPAMLESTIRQIVEHENGDIQKAKGVIREGIERAKQEAEAGRQAKEREDSRRMAEETIRKAKETLAKTKTPVAPKITSPQRMAMTPSPTKVTAKPVQREDKVSASVPHLPETSASIAGSPHRSHKQKEKVGANAEMREHSGSLLGDVEGRVKRGERVRAMGPDASLRKGPDSSLLSQRGHLACGPDPNMYKGPNPELISAWKKEITESRMTAVV